MSLYPQQQHYGAPYPPAGLPHPPFNGYNYPYPPAAPIVQAPVFQLDPTSFRREYTNRLTELTVNSRPIIQNLSMLAQEYSRYAEIVCQCIDSHIRRVAPWMKLPSFYLLDAISKNVFEPYARHFATYVIPLFLETYNQVDQTTRGKMEEMLLTWRTGSPHGKELFGVGPQIQIERGVWGEGGSAHNTTNFYSGSGLITKPQVLSELEFTIGQKERACQANPYDAVSKAHLNVLHQLRTLVQAGVSQEELRQILDQLRSLVRSSAPPPPVPQPTNWTQPAFGTPNQPSQVPLRPPPPAFSTNYHYPPTNVKIEGSGSSSVPAPVASGSTPSTSGIQPIGDLTNLLSSLVKAGVVSSSNSTPLGAGATAIADETRMDAPDLGRESAKAYRKSLLVHRVKLSTADITKRRPNVIEFLYDRLPIQCKQCGVRFADTAVGKKTMEGHLDMHFRQNRKANQNIGRGHSRSWFVSLEDWVSDVSADAKGKGRADGVRPVNAKAAAAAELAQRDSELRAMFVVVPPGDEAKSVSCPICKETLKSEFLEDDEDWVWKNAVMKDERVYHATCHAEAQANTLAARLRTELAGRSRSVTPDLKNSRSLTPPKSGSPLKPEVRSSKSPTPETTFAGTKRKAQVDMIAGDVDSTPPLKKLALDAHVS